MRTPGAEVWGTLRQFGSGEDLRGLIGNAEKLLIARFTLTASSSKACGIQSAPLPATNTAVPILATTLTDSSRNGSSSSTTSNAFEPCRNFRINAFGWG